MKVTYFTRLETSEDEDEILVKKEGEITFVPSLGIMLRPTKSDDLMVVEDVYYCVETNKLELFLGPHAGSLGLLLSHGWRAAS